MDFKDFWGIKNKFRVGDKVKVIDIKYNSDIYGTYVGKKGKILRIHNNNEYPYVVLFSDGFDLEFVEEELELL